MDLPVRNRRVIVAGSCCLVIVVLAEIYTFSRHYETRARAFRAHFVILVEIILSFISKFIWNNLIRIKEKHIIEQEVSDQANRLKRWTAMEWILLIYIGLVHTSYLTNLFLMGREPHWFAMLAYSALGFHFQLATGLGILKLFQFALRFIQYRSNNFTDGLTCRLIDKVSIRRTVILAILYAFLATTFGIYKAAQIPEVKKVMIPIQDLQHSWEGARIVQISDVHLGPTVGWTKLNAIVDIINSLRPDIVVMTGDLVDGSVRLLEDAVSPLKRVRSKYGNFFVTGNHEYYTGDVDNWFIKLEYELGFTPLHNSNVKVIPDGGDETDEICVAGTDDVDADFLGYTGHGFNINGALHSCDDTKPVIVLAHQPRAAKALLQSQYRVDLVLAGHTHGGQFFPVLIGAYLMNPFFRGLYQHGRSHVYVSTGTQYWGVPLRLGSSMEITEITLHSAEPYRATEYM